MMLHLPFLFLLFLAEETAAEAPTTSRDASVKMAKKPVPGKTTITEVSPGNDPVAKAPTTTKDTPGKDPEKETKAKASTTTTKDMLGEGSAKETGEKALTTPTDTTGEDPMAKAAVEALTTTTDVHVEDLAEKTGVKAPATIIYAPDETAKRAALGETKIKEFSPRKYPADDAATDTPTTTSDAPKEGFTMETAANAKNTTTDALEGYSGEETTTEAPTTTTSAPEQMAKRAAPWKNTITEVPPWNDLGEGATVTLEYYFPRYYNSKYGAQVG